MWPPIIIDSSISRTGTSVQVEIFKKLSLSKFKSTITSYKDILGFYLLYRSNCDDYIKLKVKRGMFCLYNYVQSIKSKDGFYYRNYFLQ